MDLKGRQKFPTITFYCNDQTKIRFVYPDLSSMYQNLLYYGL